MKTLSKSIFVLLTTCLSLCSCELNCIDSPKKIVTTTISGSVELGLFISGDTVVLSELNDEFEETGKIFVTKTTNDLGDYCFKDIQISTEYVKISCNGYCYDFVNRSFYKGKINLSAIVKTESTTVNLNLFTTIEQDRLLYLKRGFYSYKDAKEAVLGEILHSFNMECTNIKTSEDISIAKSDSLSTILLATSIVIGNQSVNKINQFINDCKKDLEFDGIIDEDYLKSITRSSIQDLHSMISYANSYDGSSYSYSLPKEKIKKLEEERSKLTEYYSVEQTRLNKQIFELKSQNCE